jgi:hypothetical protein
MKIRKLWRERPVLYRGKFGIPSPLIRRLAIAKTHMVLAETANHNAKVDQFYLVIDNVLSAVIVAKEHTLTTTDHRQKIEKFFQHLRKRAKFRIIEKEDFDRFYKLWLKSRYQLYLPKWSEVYQMRLFALHLYDFAVTELARFFKSDEIILRGEIDKLLKIYQSEAILEESEYALQTRQHEAEVAGEMHGGKLVRKLLNPWNFIDVSLLTDRKEISETIDKSGKTRTLLRDALESLDKLVTKIQNENFMRIASKIAHAKSRKSHVSMETAAREAIEAASKHPELFKFRLAFNFNYDSSEPKETLSMFGRLFLRTIGTESPYKVQKSGWENFKLSKKTGTRIQSK